MQLIEVTDTAAIKDFLKVNALLNQKNPAYIRPIDNEVKDVFDPSKNKNYKYGETNRWIAKDDTGALIGRIAAFTNSKYINKGTEYKTGGIGFFDSINDQAVANTLFDTAKAWLQSKDMEAMDGPINFGDRDKWWGLMVEGFDKEPIAAGCSRKACAARASSCSFSFLRFLVRKCTKVRPSAKLIALLTTRRTICEVSMNQPMGAGNLLLSRSR